MTDCAGQAAAATSTSRAETLPWPGQMQSAPAGRMNLDKDDDVGIVSSEHDGEGDEGMIPSSDEERARQIEGEGGAATSTGATAAATTTAAAASATTTAAGAPTAVPTTPTRKHKPQGVPVSLPKIRAKQQQQQQRQHEQTTSSAREAATASIWKPAAATATTNNQVEQQEVQPTSADICAALMSLKGYMQTNQDGTTHNSDETETFLGDISRRLMEHDRRMKSLDSRIDRVEKHGGGGEGKLTEDITARLDQLTQWMEDQKTASQRQEKNYKFQLDKIGATATAAAAVAASLTTTSPTTREPPPFTIVLEASEKIDQERCANEYRDDWVRGW